MRFWRWIGDRLFTPDAIYGLILFSALISATSDANETAIEVLLIAGFTLVTFWAAHVFASTMATHGVGDEAGDALGASIRRAIGHSSGMLYASVLPSLALLLGVFGVLSTDDAVSLALLFAMILLGVLGYESFARRGRSRPVRVVGAIGTAFFGFLMILLNTVVH